MPVPMSDLILAMVLSALRVAAGHYSFERMALLSLIDEKAEDEHEIIHALRAGNPAALIVWATYVVGWPILCLAAWANGWRERSRRQ